MYVIEYVGVSIGNHPDLATKALNKMDMTDPISEGGIKADITYRQEYLAIACLMDSDYQRYGSLIEDLEI